MRWSAADDRSMRDGLGVAGRPLKGWTVGRWADAHGPPARPAGWGTWGRLRRRADPRRKVGRGLGQDRDGGRQWVARATVGALAAHAAAGGRGWARARRRIRRGGRARASEPAGPGG